ncbi:nitrogen regulatory protein P-II [Candidatus Omnitrophus magneticus]|uniref:Nitrogen regulatory protein P-II n=1 Tax=Candidatus Omnitrophus magneticus TaxID=1609969 RepID=A0A0F0CV24_9BACT|nr:nitrogen regulatory protein P-II [Candidatus Omnitrophus magneticus]
MKEVTAIIRRDKLPDTKNALADLGCPSITIYSVDGRGKQKGVMYAEFDKDMADDYSTSVKLTPTPSVYAMEHDLPKAVLYVPKRMISVVVLDELVPGIIKAIIKVNQTGRYGDGKIFVSPIEESTRIRTGEVGEKTVTCEID